MQRLVLNKPYKSLVEASNTLFKWFSNNCMVGNADKYHLLTSASYEVTVKAENVIIKNSLREKLLRIVI